MGKFTTSTAAGQASVLDEASVDLPVGPSEGVGLLDQALGDTSAAPSAPETAPELAPEQQVQETDQSVPTITERSRQEVAPVQWKLTPPPTYDSDGGIQQRAENVTAAFKDNNAWEGGLAIAPSATPESGGLTGIFSHIGAIADQQKTTKPDGTAGFSTSLDPAFLMIGAAVTENIMTRLLQAETPTVDFKRPGAPEGAGQSPTTEVTKATGNVEIGQEANREYQRVKNAKAGLPTDQYTDLSPDQAALLGDALKEMYAIANPNDVQRHVEPNKVSFQLTPEGNARLNSPEAQAKRSMMFPGVNVRPSKNPPKGGQLSNEAGRVATRKQSGKVKGTPAGRQVIDEAVRNMSTVPNKVDPQRMRILFSTILPVLSGNPETAPEWANINNMGKKQLNKFNAEAKKAEREGVQYNVAEQMSNLQRNIAQQVRAVAMERKGVNYLTYYVQNFNGRIAPQQSFFDPTTSKAVRFVTTNAVPAKATPGYRVDKNLRQMYAMMLVKGADSLLPEGRERALQQATPKMREWGKQLKAALDQAMTNEEAEVIAQAIEKGIPLTDPSFPAVRPLQVQDPELLRAIDSKGEDGPHFIDGLIDFAAYMDAQDAGRPHFSYFNAYMDGKTNGIASNGIQMGSREVAFKTGVLRSQAETLLDQDTDIRDALMGSLVEELETTGLAATDPNYYTVARALYNYRQLAKDTTMTFGYGKELGSFKQDIDGTLDLLMEEDAEVAAAMESMLEDTGREDIVEALHTAYVNHLGGALSQEALDARPLMRGAATWFALMDKVFKINTATGFELNLGGEIATGETVSEQEYKIHGEGSRVARRYTTRSSAIARKGDQGIGSLAYGGSLPGPVQSLDAATVAMTASGKSWKRLKDNSNGNAYLHTIYDAFKVDAMGYDVALDEINSNWLNASMEWSYLQSTLDSLESTVKEFNAELKEFPDELPILTSPTDEFAMFGHLTEYNEEKGTFSNLNRMLGKMMEREKGETDEEFFGRMKKTGHQIMKHLQNKGFNASAPKIRDYKNFMSAMNQTVELRKRLTRMIDHTNKKKAKLKAEIERTGVPVYQYYAH